MMASKMIGQAIPLVEREAPLVQTEMTPTKTFQQAIGEQFSLHSPVDGKVTKVTADNIEVGGKKLALYHHFPLNQKTYIHHLPVVKEGDLVKRGQLLADTNYTDKGVLALGKNLTVAYLPYPGLTFEDGIVITESASKKLASQHIFKHSFEVEHGAREASLKKFQAYYPTQVRRESIKNFDDDGVIKKGSTVRPGEVVIMGLRYDMQSPENMTLKRINKALQKPWSNASVRYNGEFAGTVTDVVKRQDHIDVYVMATEPAKESDKLSGIHGNKGVITKVVADADAPHMANGSVPDVFLNPHGIIGRINLGQIYESAAGKIATKTGKPYVVKNFSPEPSNEKIAKDLKAHEISDLEEMYLPNGNAIGKVHVGRPYILRLAKTGKSGFSARMPGTGYDLNMQPTKGGEEGSKALDLMTFYSMLSHGAKKNLVDAHQKSEKNDEYWHAIEMGKPIPAPKPTFAFQKFISLLHGAGINTVKRGSDIVLAPLTDGAVRRMSHGAITEPEFLYGKDLKEKKGGFFDPHATGGLKGTHYSHIELREQLPNPVFESAIKSLTGLKSEDYQAIVSGMKYVTADGKLTDTKTPHTGGAAIGQLLSKIDIDAELKSAQSKILTTKNDAELNALNRKLRYLHALKDLDLKPQDAYMRKVVPVIPPVYRPVYEVPGKGLQVAPANELYRSLGILDRSHEYPAMKLLADSEKKDLRTDTYRATRALAGLEPVETRGKDYPIEGFISQITGSKPKDGFFLSKIINKRQDLVGRGVITSAPDFDVDELGVPEKMAWNIFRPFIVREFTMAGVGADVARQEIDAKTPRAKQMLLSAMNRRTVLMNRAPSLHKFSIMAFKPRLTEGLAVRVPPLVLKGFGGDFDGDAVTIHVPTSEEAIRESHKMFPSQNLFKPGTGELMISPSQESAIGLYFLSQESKGRDQINKLLPEKYRITGPMDAKAAKALYDRIAKEDTGTYHKIVFHLKQLGDKTAYERGFSVGVQDTIVDTKPRDLVFAQADKNAALVKKDDAKVSAIYIKAAKDAYGELKKEMKAKGNSFYHMVTSGARGKDSQLMQLISAPGIVNDAKDRPVPVPIKRSYAEGLSTSDHFISAYGARKGMMDRAIQTSAPGALSKDIMANTLDNVVTVHDCGTHEGISLPVTNADVYDRFLAKDQHGFKRNDPVTPQMVSSLNKHRVHDIIVRTPLQCLAKKGTCALCYGNDEHGGPPQVGENIGAKVGQTMSETTTQLSMKTFHTGGVAGGGPSMGGFARVQQLLRMPEYVAGEAALATQAGKITHTKKLATGGYHVHVGDKLHVVPTNRELKVGVGDHVAAGDPLSQGVLRPQDLRKYKGMKVAQDYIVDQLKSSYDAQLSEPMQRRVFETVIRSVAGNTRVVKAPHGSDFKEGELIPFPIAEHYNKTRSVEMPLHDAVGYHLKDHTGNLPALHKLTDKDVEHLKGLGYTKLGVLKDPLIHAPLLKGIERLPLEKKNWMAQLGYRYIKDTLTEGSAQAWKSQLDGNHPVPAFAYGAAFGQKKEHY
jgi:DNA-directed RNA polymerase beta' subunit